MAGSLEAEISRFEEELHGYESSSRADCLNIARHFAEWQRRQICAYINTFLIPPVEEHIALRREFNADDTYHVGKRHGFVQIARMLENGNIDEEMKDRCIMYYPSNVKVVDRASLEIDEETFNRHYMCE